MKLLKIICIFFLIYFVRRFIQLYKALKRIQDEQAPLRSQDKREYQQPGPASGDVINADFKVVD